MNKNYRKSSYSESGNCAEIGSYRKSSHSSSNGDCTEIGSYRKSSYSETGSCIEAGTGSLVVGIRDTKQAHLGDSRSVLEFSPDVFREFLIRIKQS
jgi:hypothetical protein